MFELEAHGADTFVGSGPEYPWGGLYGGQIVAQALRAAAATVDVDKPAHSLRAYFIQRGDHRQPVRYEVDRIRNGRSFATRRVVARQSVGAILNFEASFQRSEDSPTVQTVAAPTVPGPDDLEEDSWSEAFSRRVVPAAAIDQGGCTGAGRSMSWLRLNEQLGPLTDPDAALLHQCWVAYLSDDLPSDTVFAVHPAAAGQSELDRSAFFGASLDHTIWFHHPVRVDEWHLYDATCHAFSGSRGLSIGHVFSADGLHVATMAQEFLARVVDAMESR